MAKAHKKLIILNTFKELTRAEQLDVCFEVMKHLDPLSESEGKKFEETMKAYAAEKARDVPWAEPEKGEFEPDKNEDEPEDDKPES